MTAEVLEYVQPVQHQSILKITSEYLDDNPFAEKVLALSTVAISVFCSLYSLAKTGPTLTAFWGIIGGIYFADILSYVAHWYFDNVDDIDQLDVQYPGLAKIARDFQSHHVDTKNVAGKFFRAGTGIMTVAAVWPFLGFAFCLESRYPALALPLFTASIYGPLVANTHIWAHQLNPVHWSVLALQKIGLILRPSEHKQHHVHLDGKLFSGSHYGLASGWSNAILDLIFAHSSKVAKVTRKNLPNSRQSAAAYALNLISMSPFLIIIMNSDMNSNPVQVISLIISTVVGIAFHLIEGSGGDIEHDLGILDVISSGSTAIAWVANPGEEILEILTIGLLCASWDHVSAMPMLIAAVSLGVWKAFVVLPQVQAYLAISAMIFGAVMYGKSKEWVAAHSLWHLSLAVFVATVMSSNQSTTVAQALIANF